MLKDETTVARLKRQHPESLRTTRLRAPKKISWPGMHPAGAPGTPPSQSFQTADYSRHCDIETVTILASLSKKSGSFVAFAFHFCWPYLMHYFFIFCKPTGILVAPSFRAHLTRSTSPLNSLPRSSCHMSLASFRVIHGVRHRDWVRLSGRSSPSVAASSPHGHTGDKRDTSRRCGTCQWGGFVKRP